MKTSSTDKLLDVETWLNTLHKVEQRFINIELELKVFKSLPVVDVIFLCKNGQKFTLFWSVSYTPMML